MMDGTVLGLRMLCPCQFSQDEQQLFAAAGVLAGVWAWNDDKQLTHGHVKRHTLPQILPVVPAEVLSLTSWTKMVDYS